MFVNNYVHQCVAVLPLLAIVNCLMFWLLCHIVLMSVAFCRCPYLTKKKNCFRSWWTKMFHWWELLGLSRWQMLITQCCQKRRRQRSAKRLTLFLVGVFYLSLLSCCILARMMFNVTVFGWQFDNLLFCSESNTWSWILTLAEWTSLSC